MSSTEHEEFYKTSEQYTTMLQTHGPEYFEPYIRKVVKHIPKGAKILDLGCGTGLSSRLLADQGYEVVGVDLSEKFLDKRFVGHGVSLLPGDAGHLPFGGESFGAVAAYCFLEHVTDVPRVLEEVFRVLARGGKALIMSPNLLSPFLWAKSLAAAFRGRRITGVFPEGVPAHIRLLPWLSYQNILKSTSSEARFIYRVPNTAEKWVADSDASYMCAQMDLLSYWRSRGVEVANLGEGYSRLGKLIANIFPSLAGECCVFATRR